MGNQNESVDQSIKNFCNQRESPEQTAVRAQIYQKSEGFAKAMKRASDVIIGSECETDPAADQLRHMHSQSIFMVDCIHRISDLEDRLSEANEKIAQHKIDLAHNDQWWSDNSAKLVKRNIELETKIMDLQKHDAEDDALIKKLDLSNIALRGVISRMKSKRRRRK